MHVQRLGGGASPQAVLRGLHRRAQRLGVPGPAALTGQWFGSAAVLAPSVEVTPCDPSAAFPPTGPTPGPAGAIGGGWIGYLAYPDGAGAALAPAAGGWTSCVLRLDTGGTWWFESLTGESCPAELAAVVRAGAPEQAWAVRWHAPDAAAHQHRVRQCRAAIAEGEVYQACVCTRFTGALAGEAVQLFTAGVHAQDPARAAYLAGDWGAVVSFSPELFLARHDRVVSSSPIKGTLPAHRSATDLRASAKDVAENVMIVDLVRNDLGRVCRPGSITVPDLLAVHPAPGVWHLVSTVRGELRPDVTDAELLAATFPPASVTGTPKGRARQLLAGWEDGARGIYCGTVGMVSPVAGLELNVAIRTVAVAADGAVELGVGGGITIDSDPAAEWQECLDKAAATTGLSPSTPLAPQSRAASTAS
ncbi:aminodeoxychorismate synthase component I [Rhodococcus sp. X156]|uniref:aminodeoxychorismate synthase component I n=1 Tax=Rhodococcus sp. X156 TaxID=2499145 RepID=UPI000FD9C3D5|nr:aminodeoxychorismate synthase component I [Rhodococcus sp. X156]